MTSFISTFRLFLNIVSDDLLCRGNRLAELSYKWSLLMDATAWLSTLGGGHSALGEHSSIHVSISKSYIKT